MYENFVSTVPLFSRFTSINSKYIKVVIQRALANCYNVVDQVASQKNFISWDTLYYPLMIAENELQRIWSPIVHLNAVQHNNLALRKVYEDSVFDISEYRNWTNQHYGLYKAYLSLYKSSSYQKCSIIQQKTVSNILRDFRLSGVLLSQKKKSILNIWLLNYLN